LGRIPIWRSRHDQCSVGNSGILEASILVRPCEDRLARTHTWTPLEGDRDQLRENLVALNVKVSSGKRGRLRGILERGN
jgi:hypothetical protein